MSAGDYDVVIVGSGSTGSVLAARLSEDSNRSVLLLEAGRTFTREEDMPSSVLDPADLTASAPGSAESWNLKGTLIPGLHVPIPRGKVMGGSSALNGTYFIRGTQNDFDTWAKLGNDEWSYDKVLPFFKRSEHDRDFQDEWHGASGPINVRREPPDRAPEFTDAFTDACVGLGFKEEADKNGEGTGGVGPVPCNIGDGKRQSTAITYLLPALSRPNLTVIGNAHVRRVLFEGKTCVGVEADVDGQSQTFRAGETVLSAGAYRSPQLLMLSGVGPALHLRQHGITVIEDLMGVGANLMDHPEVTVAWEFSGKYKPISGRAALTSALNWTAQDSDQLGDLEILPFLCGSGDMMKSSAMMKHPLAAMKAMRGVTGKFLMDTTKTMRYPFALISIQQEDSRGTVRLASADPTMQPVIDWNILSEANDRRRFREGMKVLADVFDSPSMREIGARLRNLTSDAFATETTQDEWARNHLFAPGHAACTNRMGPDPDDGAVVDQHGKVYGVSGLRVADTSVYPKLTSRGPNATAVMVGERMAEFFD